TLRSDDDTEGLDVSPLQSAQVEEAGDPLGRRKGADLTSLLERTDAVDQQFKVVAARFAFGVHADNCSLAHDRAHQTARVAQAKVQRRCTGVIRCKIGFPARGALESPCPAPGPWQTIAQQSYAASRA